MARDDIDIEELADEGYSYDEILEELYDAGYDDDDIAEALLETGYDQQEALLDAIAEQAFDLDFFEDNVHDWADFLDMDIHDLYELYYGYGDDEG